MSEDRSRAKTQSRTKSFSSTYSSENTFFVFSYSFDLLEVFCQQFHWNVYSNYFQNVTWKMMPYSGDSTMQFVWNQTSKLVIYFRLLRESQIVKGLRHNLHASEESKLFFIELPGDEIGKNYRDILQKEGCRTSYFEVIYKRLMADYLEVMKLEIEEQGVETNAADNLGSVFGGSKKGSLGHKSHAVQSNFDKQSHVAMSRLQSKRAHVNESIAGGSVKRF